MSSTLKRNVERIRQRIEDATARSGRAPESVRLVAVTKYVDVSTTRELIAAGCKDLGESRPQELWAKADALSAEEANWHLIGHLQRNKVKRTVSWIDWLHSGDSERLLKAVNETGLQQGRVTPVLLEVNVSGDPAKHGLAADQIQPMLEGLAKLEAIRVRGLMAMAGQRDDLDSARRDFEQLRLLRDSLAKECPEQISLEELSMGMSGDFEVAIEEGATMVRVGSALFEDVAK